MILHFKQNHIEKSIDLDGHKVKQYSYFKYVAKTTFMVFDRLNLIPIDEVENYTDFIGPVVKLYKDMALVSTSFAVKWGTICKAVDKLTEQ